MASSKATPKRLRVEGVPNLYQRPADDKYECGFTGSDGRWHVKTLKARTLTEAKREQRELLGTRDRREDVSPRRITLNEVADEFFDWFESLVIRGERSERTLGNYRQRYDTHIRPTLGRRAVQTIRVNEASRFLEELRRKNKLGRDLRPTGDLLSDWTLRGILNVLGVVLRRAVKQGYIADNPVSKLDDEKPPAKNRTKARVLEAAEIALLIEHTTPAYRPLIVAAAFTGARQSELLGLRWKDVDFAAGELHIRHQLSRATRNDPAHLVPLKTGAAERTIDLAPALTNVLLEHKLASPFSREDDYIFTTETGKPVYYRNASERGLGKAAGCAGLNPAGAQRLSFHDLRHTAITHLIRSGADIAQVQRFAGHSKPSITLDVYVGEFEQRKSNDSGQRLAAVYSGVLSYPPRPSTCGASPR